MLGFLYPSLVAPLGGLAFAAAGGVSAIRARGRASASQRRAPLATAALGVSAVVALASLVLGALLLMVVDATAEFATCMRAAGTITAQDQCTKARDATVRDRLGFQLPLG
jgi:hypothetical protein